MTIDLDVLEQQYNLPSGLLSAVQQRESSGDPNAVSPAGAVGAFQFEPATAKQYGIDPTDPDQAAHGAAMMFSDLSKKYNGDVPSMLAAYNWGQGNLDRKGMENAPTETQNYIKNILPKVGGLPQGTQYASADTGNMSDAMVDNFTPALSKTDYTKMSDADLLKAVGQPASFASQDYSKMSDADLLKLVGQSPQQQPSKAAFGSNRGVAPPAPGAANDFSKSTATGMEEAPFLMAAPINAIQRGMGRLFGEGYTALGGELTPEQAEGLTNPRTQLPEGPDIIKSAGLPYHEPQTSLGVVGNMLGQAAGVGATEEAGSSLIDKLKSMPEDLKAWYNAPVDNTSSLPKNVPIPASSVKNASQNAYTYSNNVGGVLHPDNFTNNILDIMDNAKAKPIAGTVLTSEQKALNAALDEYSPLRDKPLTLEDFENLDKSLTAKESSAMDGFNPTNNSRIIGQVQDAIRARLQALKPEDVIGGKEGFDALTQHAIPLWSTQAKMSDLEQLINKANGTANPTQSMKNALNNLINSPKFNSYPAAAQDAIRQAAKRGGADDLMSIIGSRLNPIANSTLTGKAVNMVTSGVMRNVRNSMQNAKADKIMSAMTESVRGSVEKFSTVPELPAGYIKPEAPVPQANPYINENAGQLTKFPSNQSIKGLEPEAPVPQGTASDYFIPEGHAEGGIIKNREIHLSKKLELKLGRKPKAREVELAEYVGAHGVHRLLNQKDVSLPAHKMFPEKTVSEKRELFFNKKKPYTVEQIQRALG